MTLRRFLLPLAFIGLVAGLVCGPVCAQPAAAQNKWSREIDQLTASDGTLKTPTDLIVFVGSSSVRKWTTLAQDFPSYHVLNRGFGGSHLSDSVLFANRIVIPYHPRVVVLYAGDNDIAAGKTPQTVAQDFDRFEAKLHSALPNTELVYISLKPSPSRTKFRAAMEETNALIAARCATKKRCTFVDVWHPMLTPTGDMRPELFVKDQLHMNADGYRIWQSALEPVLKKGLRD